MRYIILFLILSLFFNCTNNTKESLCKSSNKYNKNDFVDEGIIEFEQFNASEYGDVANINVLDTLVVLTHFSKCSDKWIRVLDSKNGKEINSFLDYGKGPTEALGISCSGFLNDSIFWAFDMTKKELFRFKNIHKPEIMTKSKIADSFYRIDMMNENTFVGNCNFDSEFKIDEYSLTNNNVINSFGSLESLSSNIPLTVKNQLSYSDIKIRPDKSKIAIAYHYSDLIEIYSDRGNLITAIKGPIDVFPKFKVSNGFRGKDMTLSARSTFCFSSIFVTDRYIYACFSGRSFLNEQNKPEGEFGDKILVYDWKGNPIKYFYFDDKIMSFCIDESTETIYSYSFVTGNVLRGKIFI